MTRLLTERLLEAADRVPPLAAHDLRALLEAAADTISRLEEELVASRDEAAQGEPVAIWDDMTKLARATSNRRIKHGAPLYTAPQPAEQQPALDASGLVEALDITELRKLLLILRGNIGGAMWTLDDEEEELAVRTEKAIDAIAALAAHRKQEDRP